MKKKIIVIILSVLLIMSLLATPTLADENKDKENRDKGTHFQQWWNKVSKITEILDIVDDLQAQITDILDVLVNLQAQITDIQLLPGPQGEHLNLLITKILGCLYDHFIHRS